MNEQEFTVFAENNEWQDSQPDVGRTVEEICKWFHGVGCWPVAWCEGSAYGRVKELREESLEAGRLIEKTASGWVALGAEKQEESELDRAVKHLASLPTYWARNNPKDAAMIARDGAAKPKTYAPFTPMVTFADEPVSTAKPNPFAAFRSPDCDSGPSDHLNASRHQMAGMSD